MRHDMLEASPGNPSRSANLSRALAAALIVMGIASIAFYAQSDSSTASVGDFGVASAVNFADSRSTQALGTPEAPAAALPSVSVSTQQRDEPTVEDATNPHGG